MKKLELTRDQGEFLVELLGDCNLFMAGELEAEIRRVFGMTPRDCTATVAIEALSQRMTDQLLKALRTP